MSEEDSNSVSLGKNAVRRSSLKVFFKKEQTNVEELPKTLKILLLVP